MLSDCFPLMTFFMGRLGLSYRRVLEMRKSLHTSDVCISINDDAVWHLHGKGSCSTSESDTTS